MSNDITVNELKEMCAKVVEKRKITDEANDVYKAHKEELDQLEDLLLMVMEKLDLKTFKSDERMFIRTEKESLTIPQGDEKIAFFDYLKSVGHFEALATVNSATLNSWYKEENKAAKERGEPYAAIPGLAIPTLRIGLTVRKST